MSAKSSIEWTDVTWNPVRGCSLKSEGCRNCYAMKQAHRFSGKGQPYEGLTMLGQHGPSWTGNVKTVPGMLDAPLHWRKPRKIFVNSMSDLFHEDVPDEFIDRCFAVMSCAPQHTFQMLTKRPNRMVQYCSSPDLFSRLVNASNERADGSGVEGDTFHPNFVTVARNVRGYPIKRLKLPLSNVWLGVSVENQATADERIPLLLQTPAAVRWVSAEPLLGPVDLSGEYLSDRCGGRYPFPQLADEYRTKRMDRLDWVIVGGESGPGARPCDVVWIRSIKNQCQAAGVPCFVKQLGSRPFVIEGSRDAQEWSALGATAVMDDCGGIHTKDRHGRDMAEWPSDLRVREWPR